MGMKILGVIMATIVGSIFILLVGNVGDMFYPPPAGMNDWTIEQAAEYNAQLPAGALIFVPLAYAIGCLVAGWVGGKLSGAIIPPMIAGTLLLVAVVELILTSSFPTWIVVLSLGAFFPCTWIGARIANRFGGEPTETGTPAG